MICRQCGKEFVAEIPTKKFCSKECCIKNVWTRKKNNEPVARGEIFSFRCAHCNKWVHNDGYSRKYIYCSRRCHDRAKEQRKEWRKRHRGDNLGISGGMSLQSLIRRERRDLD